MGGLQGNEKVMGGFRDALTQCGLNDVIFEGWSYTWSNNRVGDDNIKQRLDRALANDVWLQIYPRTHVVHLPKRRSDHLPLLIQIKGHVPTKKRKKRQRSFKFEKLWLRDLETKDIISVVWSSPHYHHAIGKTSACAQKLSD